MIALRNEDEKELRYLVATDTSWQPLDIVRCYTLRWLVEVFFEDWKLHEGWAKQAKQPDEIGSVRGLILSLLLDHALLIHPEQLARLNARAPAYTVGSLQQTSLAQSFYALVRKLLDIGRPGHVLEQLKRMLSELFPLTESKKHMSSRNLGRQAPAPPRRKKPLACDSEPKLGAITQSSQVKTLKSSAVSLGHVFVGFGFFIAWL